MKEPNKDEVLYLTIMKEYFDQIVAGTKKTEYRDMTDYWIRRLCILEDGEPVDVKPFKYARICVGYNKIRPEALVEIKGIIVEYEEDENGKETGVEWFAIDLGEVLEVKNV